MIEAIQKALLELNMTSVEAKHEYTPYVLVSWIKDGIAVTLGRFIGIPIAAPITPHTSGRSVASAHEILAHLIESCPAGSSWPNRKGYGEVNRGPDDSTIIVVVAGTTEEDAITYASHLAVILSKAKVTVK